MNKNVYNVTDLDPSHEFAKHVFHRDQFAHYLRWTYVLNNAKPQETICDFGCGKGNLFEVFYKNRFTPKKFVGLDIRKQTIGKAMKTYEHLGYVQFIQEDLITLEHGTDLSSIQADKVCSFEVIEHVGKKNVKIFLKNFMDCGNENATYYLSTPNYNPDVGAAGNHTYPDYKGGEPVVQEFDFFELKDEIELAGFEIVKTIGTFASQYDYKKDLTGWKLEMFNHVSELFDNNVVSFLMASVIEAKYARNTMRILRRK